MRVVSYGNINLKYRSSYQEFVRLLPAVDFWLSGKVLLFRSFARCIGLKVPVAGTIMSIYESELPYRSCSFQHPFREYLTFCVLLETLASVSRCDTCVVCCCR